jgi:hypothetical protein
MNCKHARGLRLAGVLLTALFVRGLAAGDPAASSPAPGTDALAAHFAAMKNVSTLQARFDCQKRMKMLETPLVSSGTVRIAKSRGAVSVRFSTDLPYLSEVILRGGQVWMKSQHEAEWSKADQTGRPGLAAIMGQLANWSVGEAGALGDMYDVTSVSSVVPARPESKDVKNDAVTDSFALAPKNKSMAQSLQQIRLVFDQKTHGLLYVEIRSTQGDVTQYWFYDVELDAKLGQDTFSPAGVK